MMLKDRKYCSRLLLCVALALVLEILMFTYFTIYMKGQSDDLTEILDDSLVIVTAASENHYYAIVSTIYSAQKSLPNTTFIVYDLGFSPEEKEAIKQFKNTQYRVFDFSQYPTWMHLYNKSSEDSSHKSGSDGDARSKKAERAGQWAWKPIILKEVAETTRYANILWLDGDTNVKRYPQDLFDALNNQGVFTTDSVGNSTEWIHPKMFQYYNQDMRSNVFKMANAGRVGFNLKNQTAKRVLNDWVDCAMKKECIAPEGSNIFNHRQDQAALTLLMGMEGLHYGSERASSFVGHYPLPENIKEWEQSLKRNRIDTDYMTLVEFLPVAVASSSYSEQEQKIFGVQQEHQVESAERSFTYNDLFGLTKLQQSVVSPDGANILLQVSKYNTSTDATASRVVLSQLEGDKLSYPAEKLDFNGGNGFADKESNPMWFSNTKYGFIKKATGESSGDYVVLKDVEKKSLYVEQKLPFVPDNLQFDINSGRFTFTYRVYPGMSIEETIVKDKSLGDDINKVHVFDKIYIRRWDTWDDHKVSRVFATEPVALDEFAEYDFECLILNAENLMKLVDESKSTPTEPFGAASDYAWDSQSGKLLFVSPTYYNESRQAYSTSTNVYVVSNSTFECVSCGKYKEGAKSSPKLYRGEGYNYTWLEMRRPKYEADTNILVMGNLESKEMFTVLSSWNYSILSYVMSEKFDRIVFLLAEDAGESVLFRYNLTGTMGGPVKILRMGSISEMKLVPSASKDSEVLLLTSSTMNRPAELFRLEVFVDQDSDYIFDRLTFLNEIEEQYGLQEPEKFWFNGAKNEKVMGWLIKPAHFNPNKKYPLAFLIHGGPESAWHDSFSYRWNPQIFASSDYFVAMVNFHGSTGYSQDFVDSIHGNWGSYPFEDNILGLKHVLKSNPSIDSEKVCALGASYGGYMINWLNGNAPEGTFKCLVNHDGLFDLTSMYYATEELYFPEFSVDNKDSDSKHAYPPYHSKHTQTVYDKWSPSRYVNNWKTPTLVIHGGRDYRVPITEGIMTFTALQRKGIKSRLVVFEEENHWILKSKNGLKWHNEVLGWLAEFLH